MGFWLEFKRQKVSFVGTIVSIATFIYSKFVPTNVPLPVSQSFLSTMVSSGLVPVISLSIIAISLLIIFVIIGIVGYNSRRKRKK